jgi:transposase InsO family protein
MTDWAGDQVGLHFIPPGEPWRNGYVESFNSRVRDECLNINVFWSLAHARAMIRLEVRIEQPPPALGPGLPDPVPLRRELFPSMKAAVDVIADVRRRKPRCPHLALSDRSRKPCYRFDAESTWGT